MILTSNNSQNPDLDETVIYNAALASLRTHGLEDCEVSILLTDDLEIEALNRQYRHISAPTDVLAFAMHDGIDSDLHPHLLGDLVISVQTAQNQAAAQHHSLEVELAWLTVHGMLHLLGYDHQTPQEAAIMFEKQEAILRLI